MTTQTSTATVRSPQVSRNGPHLTFADDDRPGILDLNLPGPRRAREGRGGGHFILDVMRYLIRSPLLAAMTVAVAPRKGRPAAYPDKFWFFFAAAARELASGDELIATLNNETVWTEVAKEFYFEHGITLPAKPGVAMASYNSWRTNAIIDRKQQLDVLLRRFTEVSVPLALAVRHSEVGDRPTDMLNPLVHDIISGDGTVRNAPSPVRGIVDIDEDGNKSLTYQNSRAKPGNPNLARVHEAQQANSKRSGSREGLYNLAAQTKGTNTYTRTVLSVDIGTTHEAEITVAMRMFHRVYEVLGDRIPVLVYDGALTPINGQILMADYGTLCVGANYSRGLKNSAGAGESRADHFDPDTTTTTGEGQRQYGSKKGEPKRTWVTQLPDIDCHNGGHLHQHHVVADDGAIYEVDRPAYRGGTAQRLRALTSTELQRHQDDDGKYWFQLTVSADCDRGGTFSMTQDLRETELNSKGNLSWREPIANVRPIPDVADKYADVMGHRNQSESFFSWAEKCYYRHDLAASWGRESQLFDLIAVALLHNSETWAHLAYRHPGYAEELKVSIADLDPPDLSGVKKKPANELKAAKAAQLRTIEAWLPTTAPQDTTDHDEAAGPSSAAPSEIATDAAAFAAREAAAGQGEPIQTRRPPRVA